MVPCSCTSFSYNSHWLSIFIIPHQAEILIASDALRKSTGASSLDNTFCWWQHVTTWNLKSCISRGRPIKTYLVVTPAISTVLRFKTKCQQGLVICAFIPAFKKQRKVDLWVPRKIGLHSTYQASQRYIMRTHLKKIKVSNHYFSPNNFFQHFPVVAL